jgi:hypothetical protein
MGDKDKFLMLKLECPRVCRTSQVVENALQDALLSVLSFGENIDEGLHLGSFRRHLEDQFYEFDGYVTFSGSEEERISYMRDPHSCFQMYLDEFYKTLASFAECNKSVIDLTQRAYWKCELDLIKTLPNHWIIAVKKGG